MNFPKIIAYFTLLLFKFLAVNQLAAQKSSLLLNEYFHQYRLVEIAAHDLIDEQAMMMSGEYKDIRLLDWNLHLTKTDIISGNYVCTVACDGKTYRQSVPSAVPMNGYTENGDRVSLTFGEQFIQGFIRSENSLIYIEPAYHFIKGFDVGWYVIYDTKDIVAGKEHSCGVNESHRLQKRENPGMADARMLDECYIVDYAIAADYLMFDHYGTVSAVESHNIAVTNDMQTNYDDEFADELQFVITEQYIVTSSGSDPFTTSTFAGDLLDSFTDWAPSGFYLAHDVATLWTKRDLDGSTIGLAWIGTVCSLASYNICEDFNTDANLKRVLLAHEVGHNFDAVHDATSGYIMYPTVGNFTQWSAESITDIQNHYPGCACLDDCVGTTPGISFLVSFSGTIETGDSPSSPVCESPFRLHHIPVSMSLMSSVQNTISVAVLNSGTAVEGIDFILNTPTLTFPPNSSSEQFIELQIINDAIEEVTETILLELSMVSGPAIIGSIPVFTLYLTDGPDQVSSNCCSPGGYTAYGTPATSVPFIFTCLYEDGKSRFLYLPAQLASAGITAGYINALAFYTLIKFSTFPYQNFRIGMSNVPFTTLLNQPWIYTDQVFLGTVSTVQGAWVTIDFDTPFYWDGTSALYIEFCYDNTVKSSNFDYIYTTNPVGGGSGKYNELLVNNSANGCTLGAGDVVLNFNNQSYQPHFRFYKLGAAKIESAGTVNQSSFIKSGEKANFYSANEKVIASVKNLGSTDLECTTVQVATSGTSKPNLPFGGGQYAAKTIQVNADESDLYELTLYYTSTEMNTWGTDAGRLNIIKSVSPLATSTLAGVEIVRPDSVFASFGPDNAYVYKGTFSGFSYFSLTNRNIPAGSVLTSGDLVFLQASKGPLLSNKSGQQFTITVNNSGAIQVVNSPAANHTFSVDEDVAVSQSNQGVVLRAPDNNFWKVSVNNNGSLLTTSVNPLSSNRVETVTENMLVDKAGGSLILKSPDGKCWRVFINETGGLRTVNVLCP